MIRRRAVVTTLGAALVGLSGLSANAQQAQEIYIPLVSKGFQHQFWQAVKSGAEQAAKDFKVKVSFEGPETEAMVDKQIDMLSAALAKKPQAIGFAALDSQAAIPLLKKAQAAKIPVVAFDSGVDSDIPVTTTTTDNKAAAALAADKMAELIGKSGEVALVVHDQTSRTGVDRRDGFVNRIKSAYPNIRIVSVQYGGGDQLKSTEITKSILQASPNIKGIFGANEGSAIGVVNGVREMKRTGKVVVIGYDSGKQQKNAIMDGSMAGAITQNPVGMGYKTVEMAVKAVKGEKLPKIVDTGFYWYDKTNIADPKIAAVLYD
ncbi:ABC transporter substrate-binding protein [Variovorax sp. CAN2819]|nr:ABC transporter substrate-binding protein [Variovorax sp. CAN15]MDN6886697.1 ABC transporter substrate-binding protein [Variovorax sp. CAN15]